MTSDAFKTEAEAASDPAALAGRARLDERLRQRTQDERDAFWEAIRRCYGSAAEDVDG